MIAYFRTNLQKETICSLRNWQGLDVVATGNQCYNKINIRIFSGFEVWEAEEGWIFNYSLNCIQTIEEKAVRNALIRKTALKGSICIF